MRQAELSKLLLGEGFSAQQIVAIILVLDMPGVYGVDIYVPTAAYPDGFVISGKMKGGGYSIDKGR